MICFSTQSPVHCAGGLGTIMSKIDFRKIIRRKLKARKLSIPGWPKRDDGGDARKDICYFIDKDFLTGARRFIFL
jgi:hypothetical protein